MELVGGGNLGEGWGLGSDGVWVRTGVGIYMQ